MKTAGKHRFSVRAMRQWTGPVDHAQANVPAKLILKLDGNCAGAFDISATREATPDVEQIVLPLTPGDHTFTVGIANDWWEQATGYDRSLLIAPVRIAKISASTTPAPVPNACEIHGTYPVPESPLSANACTGNSITYTEAVAKFAPGTTFVTLGSMRMEARAQHCHKVTGCADWRAVDSLPYQFTSTDDRQGATRSVRWLGLPGASDPTRVALRTRTERWEPDPFRLQLSYLKGNQGFDATMKYNGLTESFEDTRFPSWVGECTSLGCDNAVGRVYGGKYFGRFTRSIVTASCLQIINEQTVHSVNDQYDTYEVGFLARY